ncbi:VPLPA-CTERM sorting domain-containing protein [Tropicibacter sp. S64]|uniref:VPLPA-CTERM sorting domain-containing protein n=1 Tax=Tropicibacter sp. S64 TaxID=3415122 RepID=UPI003C7DEB79
MKRIRSLVAAVLSFAAVSTAQAGTVNITITEEAGGVRLTGSGTFDFSGLSLAIDNGGMGNAGLIDPAGGGLMSGGIGSFVGFALDFYYFNNPFPAFGTGSPYGGTFSDGDVFGFMFLSTSAGTGDFLMLPANSNDLPVPVIALDFETIYGSDSYATRGITPGSYSASLNGNTVNLTVVSPVPLPAAGGLLLAGLGALGLKRRRRKG